MYSNRRFTDLYREIDHWMKIAKSLQEKINRLEEKLREKEYESEH